MQPFMQYREVGMISRLKIVRDVDARLFLGKIAKRVNYVNDSNANKQELENECSKC